MTNLIAGQVQVVFIGPASETRATLVASIARGRTWLDEMIGDPKATTESIAKRERCSPRKINKTISLAFLARLRPDN